MAQELISNLQPSINDTLMHFLETSTVWLYQVGFHRQLFVDPVKPHWCITGPVGPLRSTNQGWCGVKLLTMSASTHPVGYAHICHLLRGQHHCRCPNDKENPPSACLPTPTAHPSHIPPTHPLYTTCVIHITGAVK